MTPQCAGDSSVCLNVVHNPRFAWFPCHLFTLYSCFLTGIWSRDIKRKTNLAQTAVTKILKTLESRNLVKPVKSVNDGKRKIYVLYDLEPAADITGGLW